MAHFSPALAFCFAVAFPCSWAHRSAQAKLDDHSATGSSKLVGETDPVTPEKGDLHFWVLAFHPRISGSFYFDNPQLTQDPRKVVFTNEAAQFWVKSSQRSVQTPKDELDPAIAYSALHCVQRAGKFYRVYWEKSKSFWGEPGLEDWSQASAAYAARKLLFSIMSNSKEARAEVEKYLKQGSLITGAPEPKRKGWWPL